MSSEDWLNEPETRRQGISLASIAASALHGLIAEAGKSTDPKVLKLAMEHEAFNNAAMRLGYHVEIAAAVLQGKEEEEDGN